RRRHTRFSRDWSSDVCSSDLSTFAAFANFQRTQRKISLVQISFCKIYCLRKLELRRPAKSLPKSLVPMTCASVMHIRLDQKLQTPLSLLVLTRTVRF